MEHNKYKLVWNVVHISAYHFYAFVKTKEILQVNLVIDVIESRMSIEINSGCDKFIPEEMN